MLRRVSSYSVDFSLGQTLIFIGRSGSGKGTQARLFIEYLNKQPAGPKVLYLETGARWRDFIIGQGFTHKLAREVVETGGRLPDLLASWNVADYLIDNFSGREHLVIDGSPRALLEAQMMDTGFEFYGRDKVAVVFLNVSTSWAGERLTERGRSDDENQDEIRRKADWFEKDVAPAIEYYRENHRYLFLDINGEQSVEAVHSDVVKRLAQ